MTKPGPAPRRRKTSDCVRVDVRQESWRTASRQRLRLIGLMVDIVTMPCFYGGVRRYFLCPDCGKRCVFLYAPRTGSRFACRACQDLAYAVEGESRPATLLRRRRKLLALLGPQRSRPVGMHVSTFLRLWRELDVLDQKLNGLIVKKVLRTFPFLRQV